MSTRPEVAVTKPRERGTVSDLHVVTCSACGVVNDSGMERHSAQRFAWLHAEQDHDGDVERIGWA